MWDRFYSLFKRLGIDDLSWNYINFEIVKSLYSSSLRYYHNLDHIEMCLNEFDDAKKHELVTFEETFVEMALWFHDAIYIVGKEDINNELLSWQFINHLLIPFDFKNSYFLKDLIFATKHPRVLNNYLKDAKLVADIDLAIFGKDENVFNTYENNIRKEYSVYNDNDYRKGRKKIISGFLDRKQIYYTEYFKNKYEEKARINLKRLYNNLNTED